MTAITGTPNSLHSLYAIEHLECGDPMNYQPMYLFVMPIKSF
jgi:hypothetical protein